MKARLILTTLVLATTCLVMHGSERPLEKRMLHIYMPRSTMVESEKLTLGAISIMRSDDRQLMATAAAIAMGRAPLSGEKMAITRRTVTGRLAAVGIDKASVSFTGAETITLRRSEMVFSSDQLLKAAQEFLAAHHPGGNSSGWQLAGKIAPIAVPTTDEARLAVSPAPNSPAGYVKLRLSVLSNRDELAAREILFRLTYLHSEAVTTRAVPANTRITPDNTAIRTVRRMQPPNANWAAPFGMVAARNLRAGTILRSSTVRTPRLRVLVRRKQPVTMTIRGRSFIVTTRGIALADGRPGDYIQVMNIRSQKTIIARVCADGTVEPAMGR